MKKICLNCANARCQLTMIDGEEDIDTLVPLVCTITENEVNDNFTCKAFVKCLLRKEDLKCGC